MDQVAGFLNCVEEALGVSNESQISAILESLLVSPARDKALKQTKSWSSNCLIRLFHCHASFKASGKKLPELISEIKSLEPVQTWLGQENNSGWRIEASGYVTCVDMTPSENTNVNTQK